MDCFSCAQSSPEDLPVRERVVATDHWRLAHAFNSALPGWLVLVPRRHVLGFADLTDAELVELGLLQGRVSRALHRVLGCEKTYAVMFAEKQGFAHLHVHLVPRMPDQPADRRGPAVFGYLVEDEAEWVPSSEMDRIAREVGALVDTTF